MFIIQFFLSIISIDCTWLLQCVQDKAIRMGPTPIETLKFVSSSLVNGYNLSSLIFTDGSVRQIFMITVIVLTGLTF